MFFKQDVILLLFKGKQDNLRLENRLHVLFYLLIENEKTSYSFYDSTVDTSMFRKAKFHKRVYFSLRLIEIN